MKHSYITTVTSFGMPILGGNALKDSKQKSTSEALQLKETISMCSRIDVRNSTSMKHSAEERKRLKKIKKQVNLDNSFKNEKVIHIK